MKKTNIIASVAIASIVLGAISPLVYASIEGVPLGNNVVSTQVTNSSVDDLLIQLRKDKEDFKTNKLTEETELAASLKEKVSAKRKTILAKIEAAKKIKDEKRKVVLTRLIDIQIKQLENTKDRVAKMPSIKDNLKINLSAKIDEAVTELEAEKTVLGGITTPEDLKKFAQELKDLFKEKRDIVRVIVDEILFSRAKQTVVAAEARLAEIKAKIAELKTAGKDTAALDKIVAVAESKISAASEKAGKGSDVKGSTNDLKEAYKSMKSAVEKIDKTDSAE